MVFTERDIQKAAKGWLNLMVNECVDRAAAIEKAINKEELPNVDVKTLPEHVKKDLCNCLTDNLNTTAPHVPLGGKSQTRRTFAKTVGLFNKMKEQKLLTNCTKELNISKWLIHEYIPRKYEKLPPKAEALKKCKGLYGRDFKECMEAAGITPPRSIKKCVRETCG